LNIGYVKPKFKNNITSTVKSEMKNLSKNDVVVLCGGTLDVARKGLSSILQFVANTEHTNVIIIDAPHRFDLEASSYVNKEINVSNRKFNKIIKPYEYTSQLHLNMDREHFTGHGMHMNGGVKVRISGLLSSRIMELLPTHRLGTPITLSWEAETIEEMEEQMKPAAGESNFSTPELVVTGDQGKHSLTVLIGKCD
jgi:hypothetical protein